MSKFILIACLAVLGTAGYASAASSPQATSAQTDPQDNKIQRVTVSGARADDTETRRPSTASIATRTHTTLGIRYEMKM